MVFGDKLISLHNRSHGVIRHISRTTSSNFTAEHAACYFRMLSRFIWQIITQVISGEAGSRIVSNRYVISAVLIALWNDEFIILNNQISTPIKISQMRSFGILLEFEIGLISRQYQPKIVEMWHKRMMLTKNFAA